VTMIKWCCLGFQSNYQYHQPGERGSAILFGRDSQKHLEVVLQVRSVEITMERDLPNTAVPIALCTDVRILYCPWCGKNLEDYYDEWADLLMHSGFRIELP